MSLSTQSAVFLNLFLPHINKIKIKHNIDSILMDIYKNIHSSHNDNTIVLPNKIHINDDNRNSVLENISLLNDEKFVPLTIRRIINKNLSLIESYSVTIENIEFTIDFLVFDTRVNNSKYVKKIIILLRFLLSFYTTKEVKTLKISIAFTDEKKLIPDIERKLLDKDNINTALTFACRKNGEICIYRKEEWFKVLIHELMHSLCFDFARLSTNFSIQNKLKEMFKINSDFLITETYSEFWANIFHTSIISYSCLSKKDMSEFILNFQILNEFEKYFSIFSCIKVLDHMGLTYNDIINNKSKSLSLYMEDSNVFAYHILKSIWLFNTEELLIWFNNNNTNLIFSKKDEKYVNALVEKSCELYKSDDYLKNIDMVERLFNTIKYDKDYVELVKSLRMTIIEL